MTACDRKVVFGYDHQGRRVEKRVYDWEGPGPDDWAATPAERRKFVWNGWLMLLELEGSVGVPPASESIVRKYTWGLDLAGQMGSVGVSPAGLESAGGIGGLLAMQAPGAGPGGGDLDAVYTYDANGNVGQLIAWAPGFGGAQGDEWHLDRLVAHYEYDPYGGVTAQSGDYADDNPMRFSTKYWDDETGLGYWGYRYYSPALGRFLSRDPVGEPGVMLVRKAVVSTAFIPRDVAALSSAPTAPTFVAFLARDGSDDSQNPYHYARNAPHSYFDPLGLESCPCDKNPANQKCAQAEGLTASEWCQYKDIYCN